jgi:hypothetical protein
MKRILSLLFIGTMAACNNSAPATSEKIESQQTDKSTAAAPGDFSGCYRQAINRDTIFLQLQQTGNSVSGNMSSDNYEKDSSHGTVKGSIKNDTILLWYNFFSEGMHSVMEIVLKKTGNGLLRATGPITSKGDTTLFQDHNNLLFDVQQTLQKIECTK